MLLYATIPRKYIRDYMPDVPTLFVASSAYARKKLLPIKLPYPLRVTAADCGGFIATFQWGGVYKYEPAQYVEWLYTFEPLWAATMDFCCEEEITGSNDGIVRERQQKTSHMAELFYRDYGDVPWRWTPTIQGWTLKDYRTHALEMRSLIMDMNRTGMLSRVGIGTLCRRVSAKFIRSVVAEVASILPGIPLHLWGVKQRALTAKGVLHPAVVSADSAAMFYRMHNEGAVKDEERARLNMYQQEYDLKVVLPRYLEKVNLHLAKDKQLNLF